MFTLKNLARKGLIIYMLHQSKIIYQFSLYMDDQLHIL